MLCQCCRESWIDFQHWDCNSIPDKLCQTMMSNNSSMDSPLLASLLSSLVSQLLLVLLFLFPTTPNPSPPCSNLFPLLVFSSEIATSISLLSPSKKRKRSSPPQEIDDDGDESDPPFSSSRVPPSNIDNFKVFFRMSSSTFEWLTGLLEPLLECRDPIGSPLNLPAEIRLGIGLFRLASGSDYAEIASRFRVSEFTSRFCVKQLCRVLCTNFRFWVAFPNPNELGSVSSSFQLLTGFPNCCGVIDCTRFKISRGGENFQDESVVAQIVVDNSSRILNIVAGLRGNKGDSRVLKCSTLYKDVEQGRLLSDSSVDIKGVSVPQYFVGDGGYPLLPWLMVPFVDPVPASCDEHFNAGLHKMRLSGLRTVASLRKWGILNKPIEEEFKSAVACIGACSILHNALLTREDYSALSDEIQDYSVLDQSSQYYPDNSVQENTTVEKAKLIRNALATKINQDLDSNQPSC